MDKYLGKKLDGRYEIAEIIGMGGMANVYKAYDVIEGRSVAVKILRDEYMGNDEMRRRFKNESKAMAVLNHPNVVRVYDVSFSERMQSIVMEYVDGITLKEYIEQQRVLKWKEAVHFCVQILRALQHAHDKGIVHRDIKPQNIMLLSDGTIKISDFGIARFARSETRTLTDKAIGSVHYISPEQAAGSTTDARTDLYAAGVILYEMLTGQVPFEADTPVSVALKQIQSKAVEPRQINPSIPEGLQEITMHAMEKDMNKRYQSAAQMLRDIDEFKRDPSISFEYQYLNVASPKEVGKYSDAIQSARHAQGDKMTAKKKKKSKPKRAPIIPVLAGVTAAFVIVTAAFIGCMLYLNNPFAEVESVDVPDLIGQKYDDVKSSSEYRKYTLEPDGDPVYNSEYSKGVIFDQNPRPGSTMKINKVIKVKISKGAEAIILPDYTGQDVAQVIAHLDEIGLDYIDRAKFDDSVPKESVISTTPPAGTEVNVGEVVTLYVSMGRESRLISVPNLTGISPEDAKLLLSTYGLEIGQTTYDPDYEDETLFGSVVGQSVDPATQVEEGTRIDVTVAGEGSEDFPLVIPVPLPTKITEEVTMSAMQDRKEVVSEKLKPSEAETWKPSFRGKTGDVVEVNIFLNGELYQVYELDFELKGRRLLHDYSDDF